jgi:hypothetical protein
VKRNTLVAFPLYHMASKRVSRAGNGVTPRLSSPSRDDTVTVQGPGSIDDALATHTFVSGQAQQIFFFGLSSLPALGTFMVLTSVASGSDHPASSVSKDAKPEPTAWGTSRCEG